MIRTDTQGSMAFAVTVLLVMAFYAVMTSLAGERMDDELCAARAAAEPRQWLGRSGRPAGR